LAELGLFDNAAGAKVRLDDVQFAPSAFQSRPTMVPVTVIAIHSALSRLDTILCAIEVGDRVLARFG